MADAQGRNPTNGNRRRLCMSRLRSRAPASIQVNPASSFAADWKVAIPLLSPLALSPTSPNSGDLTVEVKSGKEPPRKEIAGEKPTFSAWKHPAAPFFSRTASVCSVVCIQV